MEDVLQVTEYIKTVGTTSYFEIGGECYHQNRQFSSRFQMVRM